MILSLVAPHRCVQCGALGAPWCAACRRAARPAVPRCYKCHKLSEGSRTCLACRRASPLFSVCAATRYDNYAKRLVWRLKFERARACAAPAGQLMAERTPLPAGGTVAFVPAVTNHVRQRGYDQAKLIAQAYARHAGSAASPLLLRFGQKQQRGQSRAGRLKQLEGAFHVRRPEYVRGKHILLVDDVITTGATLEAAASALKAAGAKRVSAVVFAQA